MCISLKTRLAPAALGENSVLGQVSAKAFLELAPHLPRRLPAPLPSSKVRPTFQGDHHHLCRALRSVLTKPGLHISQVDWLTVQFLRRRSVLLNRGRTRVPVGMLTCAWEAASQIRLRSSCTHRLSQGTAGCSLSSGGTQVSQRKEKRKNTTPQKKTHMPGEARD